MDKNETMQKIYDFLQIYELGVISTIHHDKQAPESAVVGFAQTEVLEIVFGTSNKSRKYANLSHNKNVSFVIGWSSETGTVQYEGVAKELTREEAREYTHLLIAKNINNKQFVDQEDQRYFLVKPSWVRFLDLSSDKGEKYELAF